MKSEKEIQDEANLIHAMNRLVSFIGGTSKMSTKDHGYTDPNDCSTPMYYHGLHIENCGVMYLTTDKPGDVLNGLEQIEGYIKKLREGIVKLSHGDGI
jgi:hypothetical protein